VFYIMLGETDEWAHLRRYDCYLDSARRGDDFIRRLWETLQSMPEYAGKSSLVLTTDHGRGDTKQNWTDHGKDVEGAEQMWIGVLGPDTPAMGARENVAVTQGQVAATAAALVGEDYHAAEPRSAPPLPGVTGTNASAAVGR
jgi:phosphopentomutase